jgi:hypothetical protein
MRHTQRLCVELEHGDARVREGLEEGTAVRLRAPDGALRFGAASGAGVAAAASARSGALSFPATPSSDSAAAWAGEGNLLDVEGPAAMPEVSRVMEWLRHTAGDGRGVLDVAIGVEVLGSGGGLRACRLRGIAWARVREGHRVRSAVARRLEALDPEDLTEPTVPAPPGARGLPRILSTIVLLPAAVGSLAPILVAAVPVGGPAGPGWTCEDDPAHPQAPTAGPFDDTGFPSGRLALADGRRVLASPQGPGRRRRLSFRHPPEERAANLRFMPSGSWGGSGLLVRAARVHAADRAHWWTELEAAPARDGVPIGPWAQWVVRARPEAWVAACEAAVGPVRRTPEGVMAGSLVFEELTASFLG